MTNQSTIIDLAKRLIAIPSTKDNRKELARVLEEVEKELKGFTIERFEKNGVASLLVYKGNKRPKRFKVLLNLHLDVVPAKEKQYTPKVEGDKLWGRGSFDMKTAGAVELFVFKELVDKVDYPLGLQIVTDEEIGGMNGTKHQVEEGVDTDFVLAGEQTGLQINTEAKGICWLEITFQGTSAHGAYLWQGDNAILQMNEFITKLQERFPIPETESWVTTANVAIVKTENTSYNKVPDTATVCLDIRYIPEDSDRLVKDIESMLPSQATLKVIEKEPSQFTAQDDTFVSQLMSSIEKVTGEKATFFRKHGGSDVRHYTSTGSSGVTFGLKGSGIHADNEWCSIKSLEDYQQILIDFLTKLK